VSVVPSGHNRITHLLDDQGGALPARPYEEALYALCRSKPELGYAIEVAARIPKTEENAGFRLQAQAELLGTLLSFYHIKCATDLLRKMRSACLPHMRSIATKSLANFEALIAPLLDGAAHRNDSQLVSELLKFYQTTCAGVAGESTQVTYDIKPAKRSSVHHAGAKFAGVFARVLAEGNVYLARHILRVMSVETRFDLIAEALRSPSKSFDVDRFLEEAAESLLDAKSFEKVSRKYQSALIDSLTHQYTRRSKWGRAFALLHSFPREDRVGCGKAYGAYCAARAGKAHGEYEGLYQIFLAETNYDTYGDPDGSARKAFFSELLCERPLAVAWVAEKHAESVNQGVWSSGMLDWQIGCAFEIMGKKSEAAPFLDRFLKSIKNNTPRFPLDTIREIEKGVAFVLALKCSQVRRGGRVQHSYVAYSALLEKLVELLDPSLRSDPHIRRFGKDDQIGAKNESRLSVLATDLARANEISAASTVMRFIGPMSPHVFNYWQTQIRPEESSAQLQKLFNEALMAASYMAVAAELSIKRSDSKTPKQNRVNVERILFCEHLVHLVGQAVEIGGFELAENLINRYEAQMRQGRDAKVDSELVTRIACAIRAGGRA
jgi:hypothetical protein